MRRLLVFCILALPLGAFAAPTNILFYGNSFTQYNNVTGTVGNIAVAAGHARPIIKGLLTGGKTLDYFINAMISAGSSSVIYTGIQPGTNWDFVVMQEYSTKPTSIGNPTDFRADAVQLAGLVRARSPQVCATLYMTWARPDLCPPYGSTFPSLAEMQAQLRTNYWLAYSDLGTANPTAPRAVAPVGDAFELGNWALTLYAADRYHAGPRGSLLAAMVIYATIYRQRVSGIPSSALATVFAQGGVNQTDWDIVAPLADEAVFGPQPPGTPANHILFDFGDNTASRITTSGPPYFNNVTNPFYLGSIAAPVFYPHVVASNNIATTIGVLISNWYQGSNQNGPTTNTFEYPATAVIDNLFNARTSWGGGGTGYLYFTGLDLTKRYLFTLFGSRIGASDNREGRYRYEGDASTPMTDQFLNAVNNYNRRIATGGIQPDSNGQILLTVGPGPNNNNADKFIYVGVIDMLVVPEPLGAWAALPLLGLLLRRRRARAHRGVPTDRALRTNTSRLPLGVALLAALLAGPAAAQTNILFYGNSFTQYNNVTGTVGNIAVAAGHARPIIKGLLTGGKTLDYFINAMISAGSSSVIYTGIQPGTNWDFVVMQEYSTKPTSIGNPTDFRADAVQLAGLVRARSPQVCATLYMTWARPDLCPPYGSTFPSLAEMQAQLRTNYWLAYSDLGTANPTAPRAVAPVGDAFELGNWALTLYAADRYHAGPRGSLLAAMVIYATIYRQRVSGIPSSALATVFAQGGVNQTDWDIVAPLADEAVFGTVSPYTYSLNTDFGADVYTTTNAGWNNMTNWTAGSSINPLVDTAGATTAVTLTLGPGWAGIASNGILAGSVFPLSAQRDGLIVPPAATASVTFAGLQPEFHCDVRVFGSSRLMTPDCRLQLQTSAGSATLDTRNNTDATVIMVNLPVNASGETALAVARVGTNAEDRAVLGILELTEDNSGAQDIYASTMLFDYGDAGMPTALTGWNNAVNPFPATIANCVDSNGTATSVSMVMSNWYGGSNTNGTQSPDPSLGYPVSATRDNAFGGIDWVASPTSHVYLTGLDSSKKYTLTFFASRTGVSDNRETEYAVFGAAGSADMVFLNAVNNTSNKVTTVAITPTAAGEIVTRLTWGPNNSSALKFWYVGVLQVNAYMPATGAVRVCQCDLGVAAYPSAGAWNNLTNAGAGAMLAGLVDTNNAATAFSLFVSNGFAAAEDVGLVTNARWAATAQRDGFVLDDSVTNALLVLRGLAPASSYTLRAFGSYAHTTPDRRMTLAGGTQSLTLDTGDNSSRTVTLTNLAPVAGEITLNTTALGATSNDYGCLGVISLGVIVPEAGAGAALLCAGLAFVRARRA